MPKNFYLVVFALLSLAFLTAAAPLQANAPVAGLESTDCMVEVPFDKVIGQDIFCYYLTVPARHADPSGDTLRLAVIVIRATDPSPNPDPLFFAQGGPGGSTIDLYTSYLFNAHRLTPNRDFVLLEQRGTLYAQPALYCAEYDDYVIENLNVILSDDESERLSRQALFTCLERFRADGIDLSSFNSVENARDIESLRLALGYEQINLYGVSYGSLLAQHYMRLHPDSLRSVILDGVVPIGSNLYLESTAHENDAFEYLFESCRADSACNRQYPDLEEVFYATILKLDETPASLLLYDLETDTEHPALLDGASLYGSIFQMLYDSTLSRLLPRIIYDAEKGNYEILNKVLSLFIFDRTMSYGMYFSVMCAEVGEFDPNNIDTSGIRPEIVEFNQDGPESILQICLDWSVPALQDEVIQPVQSDIPTLLLSGGFDPVTPASNADRVSLNLSRHYNVAFPWGAHGQLFDNACADQIIQDFLDVPSRQPDTACLSEYQSVGFFAPRDIIMLPVTLKLLRLDPSVLPGLLGLFASFLVLLSAWFLLPLAWLIGKLQPSAPDAPKASCSLRLATPFALLNAALVGIFLLAYFIALIESLDGDLQFLLFFGLPGAFRPIFILPLLALMLTFGMIILSLLGWFSDAWHTLRKIYYSLITFSALLVILVLALSGMLFALFT
jgi:pimeloyl-ACP methyl ester carboxylesterase